MTDGPLHLLMCTRAPHNTVCEGGLGFMAALLRGEEKGPKRRQWERGAEEINKVEGAPEVTVASLRRFEAEWVGPTERLPRRRLRRQGSLGERERERERVYGIVYVMPFFGYKCEVFAIHKGIE